MIFSANPTPFPSSQPVADEGVVVTVRALTHHHRKELVPAVTEALEDCGCWLRSRSGNATSLHLRFDVPLHAVAELYLSLVECGLDFDRQGHCELSLLCTLRRHAIVPAALRRTMSLRLEVTFADELEPERLRIPVAAA